MASIFTYDPDPPRVSSPWSTPRTTTPHQTPEGKLGSTRPADRDDVQRLYVEGAPEEHEAVTRLEAEPQEGPTEYKLHLLLRPRRSFLSASTGRHAPGYKRLSLGNTPNARSVSDSLLGSTPPPSSSTHSRQHRLEQLTTQLLWRLQQSSPYHSSAPDNIILPHLPDAAAQLSTPEKPARLLPGLEESKGALYEIGVSDDGTLVGLAEDEMEESLNNLRAMAASLGCTVEILRMVPVGDCEWVDERQPGSRASKVLQSSKLFVAEAFIRPDIDSFKADMRPQPSTSTAITSLPESVNCKDTAGLTAGTAESATSQLRVSLTGSTMSGKSSLLGSLSTATLDNGRGKSRLSLLKHRHEIVSGMTSSVTQELLGYEDVEDAVRVVNYASSNVAAWNDIHASVHNGRLVFLSDSAGHPRYRRTTVRGLVGWAPHWTLLCIPADSAEDSSGRSGSTPPPQEVLGAAAADLDLSHAHLELCLQLQLPLVIIITKLDLASKNGLKQTLSKLLTVLKATGRKPGIIPDTTGHVSEDDLQDVTPTALAEVKKIVNQLTRDHLSLVPILLTSAVSGHGVTRLHALLHELPIPAPDEAPTTNSSEKPPTTLFHVEDIYSTPDFRNSGTASPSESSRVIVGGCLRYGTLRLGSELILGPYASDLFLDEDDTSSGGASPRMRPHGNSAPTSRSFPGALHDGRRSGLRPSSQREWRRVLVTSMRNLRLPVRTLHAGQVGTLGIIPVQADAPIASAAMVRIRKGMVIASGSPRACRTFTARYTGMEARELTVGTSVVVYVASVRASARVISLSLDGFSPSDEGPAPPEENNDDGAFDFGFDDDDHRDNGAPSSTHDVRTLITFRFIASREYVEVGAKALVMPGGGPGLFGGHERGVKGVAGLEGFVGIVVKREG